MVGVKLRVIRFERLMCSPWHGQESGVIQMGGKVRPRGRDASRGRGAPGGIASGADASKAGGVPGSASNELSFAARSRRRPRGKPRLPSRCPGAATLKLMRLSPRECFSIMGRGA
eukprot:EG_transcript_31331